MIHELKCWPGPFQDMNEGRKRHEIRVDDRGFQVGDVLHLREWVPHSSLYPGSYTGADLRRRVTYISRGPEWGLPSGLVVMSVEAVR